LNNLQMVQQQGHWMRWGQPGPFLEGRKVQQPALGPRRP